MTSVRPRSRIGWAQVPELASWRSQARKSAQEMTSVPSASAPGPGLWEGPGTRAAVAAVSGCLASGT